MFATTPSADSMLAMPVFSSKSLAALPTGDANTSSDASTRAGSPGSSSSSSEEISGPSSPQKSTRQSGDLARRRGRSKLMLSELVMDLEVIASKSSPVLAAESAKATNCAPCTMQMMSFSPVKRTAGNAAAGTCSPPHTRPVEMVAAASTINFGDFDDAVQFSPADATLTNQTVGLSMMCTSPTKKSVDASQRSSPCVSGLGAAAAGGDASQRKPIGSPNGLGAAAAGDASQRKPIGSLSLGVAVIGADASQRSPPAYSAEQMFTYTVPPPVPKNSMAASPSTSPQGITGTCPAQCGSPCVAPMTDASQRSPAGNTLASVPSQSCNEALKFWLTGGSGPLMNDLDLAERLVAAAPDSYED